MPHIIQQNLKRGRKANRVGIGLVVLMTTCLVVSLVVGVTTLGA
ncbi:MAG: hypothetical protein U0R19_33070 [Bryobacteraceae bacterium]